VAANESSLYNEKAAKERRTLARFALFKSLDDEEIRRLERQCFWRRFEPRSQILEYAQASTEVYFVACGLVRVWLPTWRRTDVILADIGAGDFFGELAAIDGRARSASVTTLTSTVVARMPAVAFRDALSRHADVSAQILRLLAARIRVLDARVCEFSTLGVRDRVRAELLRLGRLRTDQPNRAIISPPPTNTEFAARISTHREAVSRELAALERDGLIERRRGAFVVCDVTALADLLERARGQSDSAGHVRAMSSY
jgi:CRP/FNR family cyclic AMP-dependent transcriptional regulator